MTPTPVIGNAVARYAALLVRVELAQLLRDRYGKAEPVGRAATVRARLVSDFELDLVGFLNLAQRATLEVIARGIEHSSDGMVGELRARLWLAGAEYEAGNTRYLGTSLQPSPIVLRGKLVQLSIGNGTFPPSTSWPRVVPEPKVLSRPESEPDTLEELLAAANELIGARMGAASRHKGAFGDAIAAALGVAETGAAEPDWRGAVEIKTVPVVRDASGFWRVKEDPAVSMQTVEPNRKLRRVLWIARVADGDDSVVLSWYYQEADAGVRRLLLRDLHTRPKGGAGATTRGWYVHKRFFIDSGLLRSLNG